MTEQTPTPIPVESLIGEGVDSPCRLALTTVGPLDATRFFLRCQAHHCEQEDRYPTEAQARALFRCDLGRQLSFILHSWNDDPRPRLVNLPGLCDALTWRGEYPAVWQYLNDGTCSPVTIEYRAHGGGWEETSDPDGADMFRVVNPSGYVIVSGPLDK